MNMSLGLIGRIVVVGHLCVMASSAFAQQTPKYCDRVDCVDGVVGSPEQARYFQDILLTGDAEDIRSALIELQFNVEHLHLYTSWPDQQDGYRPDLPLPAQYIPLDAFGAYLVKGTDTKPVLFKSFYLYALELWTLEQTTRWFESAAIQFAPPEESRERHVLFPHLRDIVYQHIWDQSPNEAARLFALWVPYIGPSDSIPRDIELATAERIYPESERFGADYYADYVQADPVLGPCQFITDHVDDMAPPLRGGRHSFYVEQRKIRVLPIIGANKADILQSCDAMLGETPDAFRVHLGIAGHIGIDADLKDRLMHGVSLMEPRCQRLVARADIGLVALEFQQTELSQEMLLSLELGELHPDSDAPLKVFECENVRGIILGGTNTNATTEKDERLVIPSKISNFFMRCLSERTCNEDGFLINNLGSPALAVGLASQSAFTVLPEPETDLQETLDTIANLKQLFSQTEFTENQQRNRVVFWARDWDDHSEYGPAVDALVPWFENLPVPDDRRSADAFVDYIDISREAPLLRETLRQNLQDWTAGREFREEEPLYFILKQGGGRELLAE